MVFAERGRRLIRGWWVDREPFLLSPEEGARTSLFLATVPDPAPFHGGYVTRSRLRRAFLMTWDDEPPRPFRGGYADRLVLARPDPAALDDALARSLWDESARIVGL